MRARDPLEVLSNHGLRSLSQWIVFLLTVAVLPPIAELSAAQSKISAQRAMQSAASPAASSTPPSSGESQTPEGAVNERSEGGEVVVDGRRILTVYETIGSFTARNRADKIAERIVAAANSGARPESVESVERPAWSEISAGGQLLLVVTNEDARIAGKGRAQLASEYAENIRQALLNYGREHAWHSIVKGTIYSIISTFVLAAVVLILRRGRLYVRRRLQRWIDKRTRGEQPKSGLHFTATYLVSTFMAVGTVMRWLILIALVQVYIMVILSFFPQTRSVSYAVTGWGFGALRALGNAVLAYLPNFFVIAVVAIIASQVSRLITIAFAEIGKGNLSIKGFYPEWAQPSARLIKMMVAVLVLIIVFPYLPGSKSPAFQGISIFVGVLLSLGSSSAVSNAIAGIILTYMRSFSVGDWVRIGDTVGEVEEKNMLVTRILTPKQETITIPNATVMNGSVMNYTREAKHAGVIFHTTVTIGYEAPWKTVHRLLVDAALATEHVLRTPEPFVLQTQLNDFYVSYELNAYTDTPRRMQFIYSDLHQNIQDRFNEAGVEICSPHFASLRDGNNIAIPEQYIPRGYAPPAFRIDGNKKVEEQSLAARR